MHLTCIGAAERPHTDVRAGVDWQRICHTKDGWYLIQTCLTNGKR